MKKHSFKKKENLGFLKTFVFDMNGDPKDSEISSIRLSLKYECGEFLSYSRIRIDVITSKLPTTKILMPLLIDAGHSVNPLSWTDYSHFSISR